MPKNVEIKASTADLKAVKAVAEELSGGGPEVIKQHDIFYTPSSGKSGRFKLRCFPAGNGQLIYYDRPDQAGPKTSDYAITEVPDVASLQKTLGMAIDIIGEVARKMIVFILLQTAKTCASFFS